MGTNFSAMVLWQTEFRATNQTVTGSLQKEQQRIRMDFGYTPLGTITVGGVETNDS